MSIRKYSPQKRKIPRFDARAFIRERWPRTPLMLAWLKSYGMELEYDRVIKWRTRGIIPSTHLALILALLEVEQGAPVSLIGYLKGDITREEA